MFDPVVQKPTSDLASRIVWFDAYISNVDRTVRNTNMLMWHRRLHLIDHGAALYFHHDWRDHLERASRPFAQIKDHVLLRFASRVAEVDAAMAARLDGATIEAIVALIPDAWLDDESGFASHAEHRDAYVQYLTRRLQPPRAFSRQAASEADRVRTAHV
jgi:hypothetical protein